MSGNQQPSTLNYSADMHVHDMYVYTLLYITKIYMYQNE